mmetsp:Transcript_47951/g.100249  ORF Transcript_47951/g.100249 Transcript_47951/m.100249 type:complete len:134 (-) Transcript_47951:171-572(-)
MMRATIPPMTPILKRNELNLRRSSWNFSGSVQQIQLLTRGQSVSSKLTSASLLAPMARSAVSVHYNNWISEDFVVPARWMSADVPLCDVLHTTIDVLKHLVLYLNDTSTQMWELEANLKRETYLPKRGGITSE